MDIIQTPIRLLYYSYEDDNNIIYKIKNNKIVKTRLKLGLGIIALDIKSIRHDIIVIITKTSISIHNINTQELLLIHKFKRSRTSDSLLAGSKFYFIWRDKEYDTRILIYDINENRSTIVNIDIDIKELSIHMVQNRIILIDDNKIYEFIDDRDLKLISEYDKKYYIVPFGDKLILENLDLDDKTILFSDLDGNILKKITHISIHARIYINQVIDGCLLIISSNYDGEFSIVRIDPKMNMNTYSIVDDTVLNFHLLSFNSILVRLDLDYTAIWKLDSNISEIRSGLGDLGGELSIIDENSFIAYGTYFMIDEKYKIKEIGKVEFSSIKLINAPEDYNDIINVLKVPINKGIKTLIAKFI